MSIVLARVARVATRSFVARSGFQALSTTKYSKSHEYVKIVGDIGIVGITDHAAGALGDVVYVDLPAIGSKYSAGDSFGSVESVKAASDVYSPVSGEVVEVNTDLETNPGKVNESPFEAGWFMKLKITSKAELDTLLDEKAYKQHVEDDKH